MSEAIALVAAGKHDRFRAQAWMKGYDWKEITQRTETVYDCVLSSTPTDFWTRLHRYVYFPCLDDALLIRV